MKILRQGGQPARKLDFDRLDQTYSYCFPAQIRTYFKHTIKKTKSKHSENTLSLYKIYFFRIRC